jgi:hypothetical protein
LCLSTRPKFKWHFVPGLPICPKPRGKPKACKVTSQEGSRRLARLRAKKEAEGLQGYELRGKLEQNAIWMWASWRGTKYIIRGKVVASPKSRLWWVLWIRICPWFVLTPKVLQLCTNQLVVWFVQIRVND